MTFAEYSDHWLERKRKRLKNSTVATYEALLRSYLLPAFGSSTGLRLGECLGLTVDRAEFLRRTMRIDRQLANTHGGSGFGTTKSLVSSIGLGRTTCGTSLPLL
jgi:integrase